MRVGLNLTFLAGDAGGSATYARELVAGLRRVDPGIELTAWLGSNAPDLPWLADLETVRLPVRGVGGLAHYAWDLGVMVVQARRRNIDLVHGLAYVAPPVHPGVGVVVTILDSIWKRYPGSMALPGRLVNGTLAPLLGRTADRVIAISEAAKADLVADLHIPAARIDVTPLGVSRPPPRPSAAQVDELRERLGLGGDPLMLCVAQKRAHKNITALVDAMTHVDGPARLVLPGSPNAHEAALREQAVRLGVADRIVFVGWLSDADLEVLYAASTAFVTASLMEGFGLPVLEAMARGVPVACSNVSATAEVAGEAALTFDPRDPSAIGAALQRLLDDAALRDVLAARGRERVTHFTWEATARATLAVYASVAAGPRAT